MCQTYFYMPNNPRGQFWCFMTIPITMIVVGIVVIGLTKPDRDWCNTLNNCFKNCTNHNNCQEKIQQYNGAEMFIGIGVLSGLIVWLWFYAVRNDECPGVSPFPCCDDEQPT